MKDVKAIFEGIVSQGKPAGSGGSAFRHSSSSGGKGWDHGIDVGAHRNQDHEVRATNAALDKAKKREQEVEKRNKEAEQRQKETAKMAKEEVVNEIFGFGKKKHNDEVPSLHDKKLERFPDNSRAKEWMTAKLNHALKHAPDRAHLLFSPASGEYMPHSVHVGSSWKKEHQDHYRELKKKHPDLVQKAKKDMEKHGHYMQSSVGDHQDYHGVRVHEETVTEAKHVFHVHMKADDNRLHKMVDDKTSEPIGNKPKGHKLVLKVPAADSREARNKVSKHISKNYGVNAVKSIEYKGLDEETVTEAKKFVYDKPLPAMVKAYDKRDTADLHGMHKRWSADHSSPKNNPDTSEKLLAVHHVLKSRGENVGDLPKHKNLGMTMHEETNTEKREKIKNVARPNDPEPTSEKSTLSKTGQIMTKIIEEKPTMSMPNFGLPASLIAAARQIVEKKHEDDAGDAKKMTGGKTQVELNPETNDKIDEAGKKHTVPKTPKEKKLAALASPKDKITHKDVLVGRGVVKEEEEQLDEISKGLVSRYKEKATASKAQASANKDPDTLIKRMRGIKTASSKLGQQTGSSRGGYGRSAAVYQQARVPATEEVEFSAEEIARLDAIAAQLDEAKPTIVSAPIRGANQDQSGIGTKSSSADYTISDSKKMKK